MDDVTPVRSDLGTSVLGAATIGFSVLYLISDVLELVQGGFSTGQLAITYVAEAAIPLFVLGLYAAQRPQIGTLGLVGAVAYAYAFVFFTGTVLLALVDHSPDWDSLVGDLEPWITLHGALMLVAGSAFGVAVVRAGVLPRWTGQVLVVGVVLVAVATVLPDPLPTLAAGVRDLAFAGMGFSLLTRHRSPRPVPQRGDVHVPA
ncbi:MAG: conserved rane protein of unknown function [Marmoricola sp.]|nr:conserved rane protein of unknown function [Marmoricola sp.]